MEKQFCLFLQADVFALKALLTSTFNFNVIQSLYFFTTFTKALICKYSVKFSPVQKLKSVVALHASQIEP